MGHKFSAGLHDFEVLAVYNYYQLCVDGINNSLSNNKINLEKNHEPIHDFKLSLGG